MSEGHRRRTGPSPQVWLPLLALVVAAPFWTKPPALDEESYLWMGRVLDLARPYSWTRVWQPYDADAFVYAHPPLWLWLVALAERVTTNVTALRAILGVPFVALYAWGVALWAERATHHAGLAAGLWLASAVVVLGLQDALMIDLGAVAFATAGLALYRDSLGGEHGAPRDATRRAALGGLLLGLAFSTKYTTLVLVPVLVAHLLLAGGRPLALVVALAVFAADEALIFALYGREHLWEVWARRAEIASGPLSGRVLGTFARAALLPLPLSLLVGQRKVVLAGAGLGLAVVGAAWATGGVLEPGEGGLGPAPWLFLALCATVGAVGFVRAARGLSTGGRRRRHGDRGDGVLLGGVVVAVFLGVMAAHNYASARYLLLAAAPLAMLAARSGEEVMGGKALLRVGILVGAAVALFVSVADLRYTLASAKVATMAERAALEAGADAASTRRFAAEWAPRWVLEGLGWTRYRDDEVLPDGAFVIVLGSASPGAVATEGWTRIAAVEDRDEFPLRVNDLDAGASLYAETLGALPLGWDDDALETATVWRVGR